MNKKMMKWLFNGVGGAILVVLISYLLGGGKKQTNTDEVQAGRDIRDSVIVQGDYNQQKGSGEIEGRSRPSMIFNEKEKYLDNNGALDYIENLEVNTEDIGGQDVITSIVIYTKMYLETMPSLEPLGVGYQVASTERGKKFEIIYHIQQGGGTLSMQYENQRFRLEIRNPPRDHTK